MPSMQSAACSISFETALLSRSAARMMPGRDEGEQKRILDRGNAALVVPNVPNNGGDLLHDVTFRDETGAGSISNRLTWHESWQYGRAPGPPLLLPRLGGRLRGKRLGRRSQLPRRDNV